MKDIQIIGACSDLGVTVDGSNRGPIKIIENLNKDSIIINKPNCIKSKSPNDLRKNLKEVNEFNKELFNTIKKVINEKKMPITIGGDHSIAIGSALASQEINKNIGIIWIDAHLDYNTFETTITGNLHGLPLAAINGICPDLTSFATNYINPKNTVVVGYRAKEENSNLELGNIKRMGVTVFTDEDIKKLGIEYVMNKALNIALNNTNGIHISYDLDSINPNICPGVSVKEKDGLTLDQATYIINIIKNNIDKIKSFDLVEFNPSFDINDKTLNIALKILNVLLKEH